MERFSEKSETAIRTYAKKYKGNKCELCNSTENLEQHHWNKNPFDYCENNLITLCSSCHKLVHSIKSDKKAVFKDEIISIEFVGEKMCYDLEVNGKFHNFVANGIVVHNCFLQESQRYVAYDKEKNGGEITYIIPQWVFTSAENYINSTDNPTARIIRADMLDSSDPVTLWTGLVSLVIPEVVSRDNFWKLCESEYISSREYLKAEDARGCLCNDVRTELCITGFLEDYIYEPSETSEKAGLFTLRTAMDAHPDIRVLANDLKQQFIDYGYYK